MCVCVCVCVCLEILVLKIFKLRDYFERFFVFIGSLVELYVGLHSYLCFSSLKKKNCFEKLAQHLLDTLLSVELLKPFS